MRTPLIATLLVTVCNWWPCTALSECPTSWLSFRKHCYYFSADQMSWVHADKSCRSKGGLLASIWDREEQSWVRAHMSVSSAWIGLYQPWPQQQWFWTDETLYFHATSFWNPGKPYRERVFRCAEVQSSASGWDNVDCFMKVQPYICKRAIDRCPDLTCLPCPTGSCPSPSCPTVPLPTGTTPTNPTVQTLPAAAPTNWETEICASDPSQSSCSSDDITCSCLLAMFANPKGGFKAALDHGLSVNRSIVIRGRANPNAERLIVNLRHYDSEDADSDDPTAMRLAFHFEGGTIVLNSQLDDSWGEVQTEDFAEQRPFGAGRDFKIVIFCDADAFRLTLNDMQQLDYMYRVQDLESIKWLEVWYGLLTSVRLM